MVNGQLVIGHWRGLDWSLVHWTMDGPLDRARWSAIRADKTIPIGQTKNTSIAMVKMVISWSMVIGQALSIGHWSLDRLVIGQVDNVF